MVEVDRRKQKVIADLVRRWVTSEAVRNYLRRALNLPVEQELPDEHKSLLDEIDRADKE
ncbi:MULTISPECIES: hypothetical protein [unclassified Mesorhizobium]|uniref:hypothetical protein n=1 Tax=unclassified Mesorhizobium TaxID=325217 RepID=UPI0003CE4179|nr:hypothetical protein [Mesorhizobium sp. LSHC420B00]ESX80461.1 hypothetical protein X759_12710 [Mesorhizobium sp. LSHC420B00]